MPKHVIVIRNNKSIIDMRKSVYFMMVAFLLCECLACTNNSRPFKEVAEFVMDGHVKIYECETKSEAENLSKKLEEDIQPLLNGMDGKTISIKAEDGLGLQVLSNEGTFLKGYMKYLSYAFPFNFDIKITDADKAFESLDQLCVVFYNEKGDAVYVVPYLDEAQVPSQNGLVPDTDSIEVVDSADTVAIENITNPYKDGEILHKGLYLDIEGFYMPLFVDVSKAVIERRNDEKIDGIKERGDKIRQDYIDELRKNMKDWMKNHV